MRIDGHTAKVDGQRLHFLTAGRGAPVVLLHGWQHSHHWRPIIPVLDGQFTMVAPDQRGSGGSTKPIAVDYSKRELSKDLHVLTHRVFGDTPVRLCGDDHGGSVAHQYAAMWPDEVERFADNPYAVSMDDTGR